MGSSNKIEVSEKVCRQGDLSLAQKSIWFIDQIEETGARSNRSMMLKLSGHLDHAALQHSLDGLVERHEILRTVFKPVDGEVMQQVSAAQKLPIKYTALDDIAATDNRHALMRLVRHESGPAFDLSADWPLRACLIAVNEREHVLLLTIHDIAWDEYSRQLFSRDLVAIYRASRQKDSPGPGALPAQYLDYCAWQKAAFQGEAFEQTIQFWQRKLTGIPLVHSLTLDKPRPAQQGFRAGNLKQRLAADFRDKLAELAKNHDANLFMVMQSAFAVLVGRWSLENDIVMGNTGSARAVPGHENLVGPLVNTLVLRTDLSGNPGFLELLERTKSYLESVSVCHSIPREILVNRMRPERSLSYAPLYQIVFKLEILEERFFELDNVALELMPTNEAFTDFDLELTAIESDEGLLLNWVFAESLFARESIQRMAASFEVLLQSIVAAPQCRIRQLALVPAEDRQLVQSWNATAAGYAQNVSIRSLFEAVVDNQPQAVALKCNDNLMSYALLNERSNQLARFLLVEGLEPGRSVGLCCEPSLDLIVAIMAIVKAGAVYLPLDTSYPKSRLQFMLEEAKPQWLVSKQAHLELIADSTVPIVCLDDAKTVTTLAQLPGGNPAAVTADTGGQAACYIIYTSGSTGKPKGVVGLERSVINRISWMQQTWPCATDEVLCQKTSIGFVDHLAEVFQPLLSGCRLVVVPQPLRLDLPRFCQLLQTESITRVTTAPYLLKALLANQGIDRLKRLRQIICSGETLGYSLVQLCRRLLPNVKLINLYGSTESGADTTCYEVDQFQHFNVMKYFQPNQQSDYFDRVSMGFSDANSSAASLQDLKETFRKSEIPRRPMTIDHYLSGLKDTVMPGIVQVSSQTYIGHMTSALPSFMPELSKLISHLNQNVVKVETSRSVTFLERQVLAMMHRLFFDLPHEFYDQYCQDPDHIFGVVTSGGSVSNLTALWCARNKTLVESGVSRDVLVKQGAMKAQQELGYTGGVIIGSRLMHYSMRKVASLLGIGENSIRLVPQHDNQKISMRDLEATIEGVKANGEYVIALVGVAGATETGTIDPLNKIADIAEKHKIHFHVDAAWGGAFQFSERYRDKLYGIERADSITICSHKQLYLPLGISLCMFRSSQSANNIAVHANYQATAGSYDLGQFSLEGSRPANAVLLHASLHLLSTSGYAWLIEQSMDKADYFAKLVQANDHFELIGQPEINIINYRFVPAQIFSRSKKRYSEEENQVIDDAVRTIQETQFAHGKTFVSKTRILHSSHADYPLWVFRVVISNPLTNHEDLHAVLQEQMAIASRIFDDGELYSRVIIRSELFDAGEQEKFDHRAIPIGTPISNTCVMLLDSDLAPVPVGAPGELCVAGDGLAQGYLNNEAETSEKFFTMSEGEYQGMRFYRSGDLARWRTDGNLEFLGRIDNQVKLRGFRIELGEIEHALQRLEQVEDAAVVLRRREDGNKYLIAYIKAVNDVEGLEKQLRKQLAVSLPGHMIPSSLVFLEEFPVTPDGKLDRKALKPREAPGLQETQRNAPRTESEKILVQLWSQVLNVPEGKIGIDDNFFEFGGDSLLVLRAINQAREKNLSFSVTQLFQNQTIRLLAEVGG